MSLIELRAAGAFALATVLLATSVAADPQLSTGLAIGVAGKGERRELWTSTDLAAGLRGEVLFARRKDADFGVGPYAELVTTTGFSNFEVGGGLALLIPVHPYLPVALSSGGYVGASQPWGFAPGVASEIFWGSHGYNYHSIYVMSTGLFMGVRYGLGDSREVTLLGGARIDLEILALPLFLAWGAIQGSHR
ncbi:MAG TPA: hypothetical protein VJT73_03575 [Polyangiaceae bacterium]|nr:hypothetical protein [Polyangiaceae bacterium]